MFLYDLSLCCPVLMCAIGGNGAFLFATDFTDETQASQLLLSVMIRVIRAENSG